MFSLTYTPPLALRKHFLFPIRYIGSFFTFTCRKLPSCLLMLCMKILLRGPLVNFFITYHVDHLIMVPLCTSLWLILFRYKAVIRVIFWVTQGLYRVLCLSCTVHFISLKVKRDDCWAACQLCFSAIIPLPFAIETCSFLWEKNNNFRFDLLQHTANYCTFGKAWKTGWFLRQYIGRTTDHFLNRHSRPK